MYNDSDSHVVIGYNKRPAKVARTESELNGTPFHLFKFFRTEFTFP